MSTADITFHISDRDARIELMRAALCGDLATEHADLVTFCEDRFGAGLYMTQMVLVPYARVLADDPDGVPEIRAAIIDSDMPGIWVEPAPSRSARA